MKKLITIENHTLYQPAIKKNGVVVDLGAHRGLFGKQMKTLFNSNCFLIEADPYLYRNIALDEKIKVFNYAIAGESGEIKFHLHHNPEENTIKSHTGTGVKETVTVEAITLESFLKQNNLNDVNILKVDIEGAEFEMFKTLRDETLMNIHLITIEFHDWMMNNTPEVEAIKDRMKKNGFLEIKFTRRNVDILFINTRHVQISNLEYQFLKFIRYPRWIIWVIKSRLSMWK
jgi:FkbM family methyltransferase